MHLITSLQEQVCSSYEMPPMLICAYSETQELDYCRRIDELTAELDGMVGVNESLAADLKAAKLHASLSDEKLLKLDEEVETLRGLVSGYLSRPESEQKLMSTREKVFWGKIATDQLLEETKPPKSYPIIRAHPIHTSGFSVN